jgi:hypothetical protein
MAEARQAATARRIIAYLRTEVGALSVAATDVERAKVLARIYQRGRHDERSKIYFQASMARRRWKAS